MKNIHVRRFSTAESWQGVIEPEDRTWVVLIDDKGEATFWRQCKADAFELPPEVGTAREFYIDVELPGGRLLVDDAVPVQEPPQPGQPRSLDFTLVPTDGSDVPVDEGKGPLAGYWAHLNARHVSCFGETEHLAMRNLLNYVAELCTAGCLDHTGRPMPGHLQRRYNAVFGDPTPESPSV